VFSIANRELAFWLQIFLDGQQPSSKAFKGLKHRGALNALFVTYVRAENRLAHYLFQDILF
jgi:hypothetical protein